MAVMGNFTRPSEIVNYEQQLADDIVQYTYDPLGFVRYSFPWGEQSTELEDSSGPRVWQSQVLSVIGKHLQKPTTRYEPLRIAIASGHGIGKSALIAMVSSWGLSTCDDCKILTTATTGNQLRTKTIPEAHKWFQMSINKHWWDLRAMSIISTDKAHEQLWRSDYVTWSDDNIEAFSGLHNKGKRIILIFDEASGISDKIWETAEGALTDANTEIIWLAFGNPMHNSGRFFECFGKYKHRWKTAHIDSRNVEGTNKKEINEWVETYGEDSDFVRSRVKGQFPRAGSNQLIPSNLVAAARKNHALGYGDLPFILSVDVARYGDDRTIIGSRQGRFAQCLGKYRGLSTAETGEKVIEFIDTLSPDATVIDGTGIGAAVVDHLRYRGYTTRIFEFSSVEKADDTAAYFNKRAETWCLLRDWLRQPGVEIPDDQEFEVDLTSPQYFFSSNQQIQLERKEDIKKRGLPSPDCGDMLAMTFYPKVKSKRTKKDPKYVVPPSNQHAWMA